MSSSQSELLTAYVRDTDERAFEGLVKEFSGLVVGTATRRTGDPELAREISQNVFTLLAQKAGTIRNAAALPAWLHRTTLFECANAVRRERNHRNKMNALAADQTQSTAPPDGGESLEPVWRDAMPHLDNSVDQLGPGDRDAVLLRFYGGKTFAEMGEALGKSEDASRKQTSRALEKLSRLLRRNGVKLSAAAIGSGLGVRLAHDVPESVATSMAKSALAAGAAPATGASTLASTLATNTAITMITKTTVTVTGLAALIFFAAIGTGYYAGAEYRRAQHAETSGPEHPAESEYHATASMTSAADDPPVKTRSNAATNKPRGLDEILAEATTVAREIGDNRRARLQIGTVVDEIAPADFAAAANHLLGLKDESHVLVNLSLVILDRWGKIDPRAALAFWSEHFRGTRQEFAMRAAVEAWAERDPAATFAWQQSEEAASQFTPNVLRGTLSRILESWAERDPDSAIDGFESLPFDDQHRANSAFNDLAGNPETRDPLVARIAKIEDEKLRAEIAEEIAESWADKDATGAMAWVESLQWKNPHIGFRVHAEVIDPLVKTGEFQKAIDWLWPQTPDQFKEMVLANFVGRAWAERDSAAASSWLTEHGFSPDDYLKERE